MEDVKPQTPDRPKFEIMALGAREMFMQVIPDDKIWKREIGFALQLLRGSQYLQDVTKTAAGADSIRNAVVNLALCGTTLNPARALAYLVPRKVGGVMMCCLDFSYRGLAGIAMDSGSVKHLAPRLVYTFDKFDFKEVDGETHITHEPGLTPDEKFTGIDAGFWDFMICGYMIATLHDNTKIISSPFLKWKLKKAMDTSMTSSGKTPWRTHPDEMCFKTLIKHAYKLLPQTDRMSKAVEVLNEHEGIEIKPARTTDYFEAEFETVEEGAETAPTNCPSCQQPLEDGKCYGTSCDLGQPRPEA